MEELRRSPSTYQPRLRRAVRSPRYRPVLCHSLSCSASLLLVQATFYVACCRAALGYPLSPEVLSVCPDLQSLHIATLRAGFSLSGISTFKACYSYLNTRSAPELLLPSSNASEVFWTFYMQAEAWAREALVACNGTKDGGSTEGSGQLIQALPYQAQCALDEGSQDGRAEWACPDSDSPLNLLLQAKADMQKWNSSCNGGRLQTLSGSSKLSASVAMDVDVLFDCIHLLASAVNRTKKSIVKSCSVLNGRSTSLKAGFNRSSSCSGHLCYRFTSFLDKYKARLCQLVFEMEVTLIFLKLDKLENQFRRHFSVEDAPTSSEISNFSVFQQSAVVFCRSIFPERTVEGENTEPVSRNSSDPPPKLCENTCHQLRNILNVLGNYADVDKSQLLQLLRSEAIRACSSRHQFGSNDYCIDFDQNMTVYLRSPSLTPPVVFCVNLSCHFPLRATSNPDHWTLSVQSHLREQYNISDTCFPQLALPFNASKLPCGMDCVSIRYSKSEESAFRVVATTLGSISVLFSLIAICAYVLNRRKLRHSAWRLTVYVNITFVIGAGSQSLLASVTDLGERLACYSDKTLRQNEPNSNEGVSLCVIFATKTMFGHFSLMYFYACLAIEWYMMTSSLSKVSTRAVSSQHEKWRHWAYIVIVLVLSTGLTAGALAIQQLTGMPAQGTCFLDVSDSFYFFTVSWMVVTVIMLTSLGLGLPKLRKIYREMTLFQWLPMRSVGAKLDRNQTKSARTRKNAKGLHRLTKLTSAYIVVITVSLWAITLWKIYSFATRGDTREGMVRHIKCLLSSCNQSACPPLPASYFAELIVHEIYTAACGVIFSLWAFDWKLYWREHFSCLANRVRQSSRFSNISSRSTDRSQPSDSHKLPSYLFRDLLDHTSANSGRATPATADHHRNRDKGLTTQARQQVTNGKNKETDNGAVLLYYTSV